MPYLAIINCTTYLLKPRRYNKNNRKHNLKWNYQRCTIIIIKYKLDK